MDSEVVAVFAISPHVYVDAGFSAPTVPVQYDEESVINQVADEVDADILLVGRRGRGGVAELRLGSVSQELVLHSKRPVLVISSLPKH
jgi:nucleotide-binding universal stress UspA family protein